MAKETIIAGDLTKLRSYQWIDDVALFTTPLTSVYTGTISSVATKYPFVSLTMSGSVSASVLEGMMWRVTNGSTIISQGVIRKAPSGSTLYISETPLGAYGFATNIEAPILAGYTVTVYNHRPLWSLYSRIAQNTFYKQWDVPYTTQNELSQPVSNTGAWQAGKIASGETTARFTLPLRGVNESFVVDAQPPSGYLWALPSGVTLVSGYALSNSVIEVDAEAGRHLISLTASRAGRSHTAYMWLFVTAGATALTETNAVSIESDNQNRLGRIVKFRVWGSSLESTLYRGAGVMLKEWPRYNGESLSTDVAVDNFTGYISEIELSHDGNIPSALITVESPMVYAQRLGQPSQSLTEVANPSKWTECDSGFSNPIGFAYYLIRWHTPNLLAMHDTDLGGFDTPRRKYLEVNNKNLQANLNVIAEYIAGNIGSASDGTTVLRKNPLYMSNTDRNNVDTVLTFLEEDVKAPFTYFRRMYNAFSDVRGGAFAFNGTGKPKAWYVGRRWGQGSSSTEMPNLTVTASEGVAKAKEIIGHYTAEQNAEIQEIGIDLLRNQDVIDPAYMLWHGITISSSFDPYASGFSGTRLLATEITREWEVDNGGLKKRITVVGQVETFGQAGEELPVGNVKGISQAGWSTGTPIFWTPQLSSGMFGAGNSASTAFALTETGLLALTTNIYSASPIWTDLNQFMNSEDVNDFDFDYGSDFFAQGRNLAAPLGLYVVTTSGSTANIWYFPDILRGFGATLVTTLTLSDSTVTSEARIKCSETFPSLVLAGFKDGTGTRYSRSTDGGATFGALTRVGSSITDISENDNAPLGMWVDGQRQLISAPDGSSDYGTYYASTAAGAFSKLGSSQDSIFPQKAISIEPSGTTAYVASQSITDYDIDFDGSDDIDEGNPITDAPRWRAIKTGANVSGATGGIAAVGNPANAYRFTQTGNFSTYPTNYVGLEFHFRLIGGSSDFNAYITAMSFDVWFSFGGGVGATVNTRFGTTNFGSGSASAWQTVSETGLELVSNATIYIAPDANILATSWQVRIDNVHIEVLIPKLYKVLTFTGTPSWSDISTAPEANTVIKGAPDRPNAFFVDVVNNQSLHMITGVSEDWFNSIDAGANWSKVIGDTTYRALYTVGDALIAGGENLALAISLDGGASFTSITGDLNTLWAGSPNIKKV